MSEKVLRSRMGRRFLPQPALAGQVLPSQLTEGALRMDLAARVGQLRDGTRTPVSVKSIRRASVGRRGP
jgi:hypothetical protein